MPQEHLSGRHRDPGSGAAREVQGHARRSRDVLRLHRAPTCAAGWPRSARRRSTRFAAAPTCCARAPISTSTANATSILSEVLRLPERSPFSDVRNADEPHVDDMCGPDEVVRLRPADRAVGARIAHNIVAARNGGETVAAQTRRYVGSAGQSFGAFITDGLHARTRRRSQRLRRQEHGRRHASIVRTPGSPDEPVDRQRVLLRRARRRRRSSPARPANGSRCATAARGSSSKAPATHACEYMTAGIGGHPRPGRTQRGLAG